jgi:hypothetical protein
VIDQNPAHHLGADREEVNPVLPPNLLDFNKPKLGLMHQRRCLNGLAATLAAQTGARDPAQLGIQRFNNPIVCVVVAAAPCLKELGDS